MNEYAGSLSVIVCGFFEFIVIAYIYGCISVCELFFYLNFVI
jgi:hypothetical protein